MNPPLVVPRQLSATDLIARLEAVPFSRWHLRARIIVGSATFFDAFDALSLAFVLPILVREWGITPAQIGWLIATGYIGQFAGALIFGALAERHGRIRSAAGAVAIMSVMSLVCAATGTFSALFAGRLIQGIGVGGEMPVAAAYINELSKALGRGRFFLLYELIFPVGLMMTGQISALLVPTLGWKIMFLIGGIPGLIITALLLRLPESPRWLISKGRLAEAEAVISDIERSASVRLQPSRDTRASASLAEAFGGGGKADIAEGVPVRLKPDTTETRATVAWVVSSAVRRSPEGEVGSQTSDDTARGRWRDLISGAYLGRTAVVWILWAAAYFITNGLNNWMPTLYNSVYHLTLQQSLRAGTLTNVAQVIVLLGCAFVIDRIGRRTWTVISFLIGSVLLAALGVLASQSVAAVIVLVTLSYGVLGSVNAVLYLYTPEIYPTRMRAIGTGAATCWLRLASAAAPVLVGYLVQTEGIGSVFLMFAGVGVVGALAARAMLETRNRRLEDIAV